MATMNVMDAVVKVMEDEGVEVVFGVPGAAMLPLYKATSGSVMIERETNALMGLSVDEINEYEPIVDGVKEGAGRVIGGIPEGISEPWRSISGRYYRPVWRPPTRKSPCSTPWRPGSMAWRVGCSCSRRVRRRDR